MLNLQPPRHISTLPTTTKLRSAAKCRDVPISDVKRSTSTLSHSRLTVHVALRRLHHDCSVRLRVSASAEKRP
jgi:hypothetical protein